jgi:hypothetical protein
VRDNRYLAARIELEDLLATEPEIVKQRREKLREVLLKVGPTKQHCDTLTPAGKLPRCLPEEEHQRAIKHMLTGCVGFCLTLNWWCAMNTKVAQPQ